MFRLTRIDCFECRAEFDSLFDGVPIQPGSFPPRLTGETLFPLHGTFPARTVNNVDSIKLCKPTSIDPVGLIRAFATPRRFRKDVFFSRNEARDSRARNQRTSCVTRAETRSSGSISASRRANMTRIPSPGSRGSCKLEFRVEELQF